MSSRLQSHVVPVPIRCCRRFGPSRLAPAGEAVRPAGSRAVPRASSVGASSAMWWPGATGAPCTWPASAARSRPARPSVTGDAPSSDGRADSTIPFLHELDLLCSQRSALNAATPSCARPYVAAASSLLSRLERVPALGDGFAPSIGAGLCHGDLIGDNLLRDRGGRMWPVDWDAAALAPRELYVSLFTAGGSRGFSTAASATPADPPSMRRDRLLPASPQLRRPG
jgi:hypothetical protein